MGDLAFCLSELSDAEQYYQKSAELLKKSEDYWLAAAKESLAYVLLKLNNNAVGKKRTLLSQSLDEASAIFSTLKQCPSVYLEFLLRSSLFHILANQTELASKALSLFCSYEITINASRLNVTQDQCNRFLKAARMYESFAWLRKASFYYRMAAMHTVNDSAKSSEWVACHRLLMKAVRGYGLGNEQTSKSGFIQLQSRLLMDLFRSALAFSNYPLALRHACQTLDVGGDTLFAYQLSQIFADMRKIAKLGEFSNSLEAPLIIDSDQVLLPLKSAQYPRLLLAQFHPETIERSSTIIRPSKRNEKKTFIYSPFMNSDRAKEPTCACIGETIMVIVQVENNFSLALKLDRMSLITSPKTDVKCEVISDVTLIPGQAMSIVLSCSSEKPCNLLILGCETTVNGITRKILFSDVLPSNNKQSCFDIEILQSQLPYLKILNEKELEVKTYLGEEDSILIPFINDIPQVQPNVVDLTLRGVPIAIEKALSVMFHSENNLCVKVDWNIMPSRFSSSFDAQAKFVYGSMSDKEATNSFARSLNFTFHMQILSCVTCTIVGIERFNMKEIVFDVKVEHPDHEGNPVRVFSQDDTEQKCVVANGSKFHLHCPVLTEKVNEFLAVTPIDCNILDLSSLLPFHWQILREDGDGVLKTGKCAVLLCGEQLIKQLHSPPFQTEVTWWPNESSELSAATYGK